MCRAGWAFVVLREDNTLAYGAYGPLPLEQRDHVILAAELWAVIMLLRNAVAPLRIHTDCQNVIDGIERGPAWATRPGRRHGPLWHIIWQLVGEHGGISGETISFQKVKAHATKNEREVMGNRTFVGNGHADRLAKKGVEQNDFPKWHRDTYTTKFDLTVDVLEFATKVGTRTVHVVDTCADLKGERMHRPSAPDLPAEGAEEIVEIL